jgi:hypothetical protein
MSTSFLNALNESAVTYVADLAPGWATPADDYLPIGWTEQPEGPGWEATSPQGEIRAFATREEAHAWRVSEVLAYVAYFEGAAA